MTETGNNIEKDAKQAASRWGGVDTARLLAAQDVIVRPLPLQENDGSGLVEPLIEHSKHFYSTDRNL